MTEKKAVGFRDADARAVLAAIDADETIAYLQSLVRVPSVNPPGDVVEAVRICRMPLDGAGFAVQEFTHAPGKPNLVATWGNPQGPQLAFNAHLDVVPIGDESAWKYAPFGGEIANGRVYGRGAGSLGCGVARAVGRHRGRG